MEPSKREIEEAAEDILQTVDEHEYAQASVRTSVAFYKEIIRQLRTVIESSVEEDSGGGHIAEDDDEDVPE